MASGRDFIAFVDNVKTTLQYSNQQVVDAAEKLNELLSATSSSDSQVVARKDNFDEAIQRAKERADELLLELEEFPDNDHARDIRAELEAAVTCWDSQKRLFDREYCDFQQHILETASGKSSKTSRSVSRDSRTSTTSNLRLQAHLKRIEAEQAARAAQVLASRAEAEARFRR